jgi:hypothetical protein
MTFDKTESTNHSEKASAAVSPLANQVFKNPMDFLNTLKKDFDHDFSKADLVFYANHGEDAKGRLAAKIASEHFDELYRMPKLLIEDCDEKHRDTSNSQSGQKMVTLSDLDIDTKLIQQKLGGDLRDYELKEGLVVGVFGAADVVMVGTAVSLGSIAPAILPIAALAVGTATTGGVVAVKEMINANKQYKAESKSDPIMLSSWIRGAR